jgi:protein-tyrosine phosphatase
MIKIFLPLILALPLITHAQVADSTQREIKLHGAINFRDIGGYEAKDGKHVKWGKIYRSASLNNLTPDDLQKLQSLSLAWVGDFRGPYEVKAAPDKLPPSATRVSLPAGSENIGDSNYMKNMTRQMMKGDSALVGFYSTLTPFKERYKPVFDELLLLNKDSALLFHCTAGKDRTGIAAALILYALGVDEKTIMSDYVATNYYRAAENQRAVAGMVKGYGVDEATAKGMMAARESYLNATFTAIRNNYGSIDNYLEKEMGLDKKKRKKLADLYLQ